MLPERPPDEEAPPPQHQKPPPMHQSEPDTSSSQLGCPIESLNYEIIESDVIKQDWMTSEMYQYIFMKWTFCFVIGLIVSLVGFFNNLAIENIVGFKFVITSNLIMARKFWLAFVVFVSSNLGLILFASLITAFIAPEAAGSGIPEVKAYLNGVDAPAILSFPTLLVKIVGNIFAVSSSLNIGKAGPMIHTGACIAALVGDGGPQIFNINLKWLHLLKNDLDKRDFVTCGSAAGLAAAFRAPIGGVLFTLQEMASWWRTALLWRAFFTTTIVALVLRALIGVVCLRGDCGLFNNGGLIVYNVTSVEISYQLKDIPPILLLALIGGVLGTLYNLLLTKILNFYKSINKKGIVYKIILACLVSIFTSCFLFGLPWFGSCHPCPPDTLHHCPSIARSGNYKKFQCPPGHYNDLASLFFNTNDDAIKNLFSKDTRSEFHYNSVLLFFSSCFLLSLVSYGVVAPAGLFVPIIVIGASYGRLFGICVEPTSTLNPGLFAVLGSASLLGGSMRMTVSLCVIILELTDDLLLLPLVMVVALVSKAVADVFDKNIYDMMMAFKGLPYLVGEGEVYMRKLTAGDMVVGPVKSFCGVEKVGNVVRVLRTTGHNGFPVVSQSADSVSLLFGSILRAHLIVLLKKKMFLRASTGRLCSEELSQFSGDDFRGINNDRIEDVKVSEEEMEMFLDLHPFANTSPYMVVETMSLAKAFSLFRELGLRHLLVIPNSINVSERGPVVGVLTRHDFMREHILKLHPRLSPNYKWKSLRFRCYYLMEKYIFRQQYN